MSMVRMTGVRMRKVGGGRKGGEEEDADEQGVWIQEEEGMTV